MRTALRLLTVALVSGGSTLIFLPPAHAASTSTLVPTHEAWFQPNPTCGAPSGCLTPGALPAPAPTSPYKAGTMHIGVASGQETARSYLALPRSGVLDTVMGAVLSVPLDTAQANGSQAPETAKLQACLFIGAITPAEGSIAAPPKADCKASAPVTYVATPTPHLRADLAPLLTGLSTASGIVLLPDATKAAQTDTWRAVFSARTRTDAAKTAPAIVTLTLADRQVAEGTVEVPLTAPTPAPPIGTGFAPAPTPDVPEPVGVEPQFAPATTSGSQAVAQPQIVTVGYAYPTVWLLPLAFLLLVPAAAKALTRDLTPTA